MRQFASSGLRIWNLGREAKLVYSFFGLFALLALASSALLYDDMVGARGDRIGAYYAGDSRPDLPRANPRGGPEIALPDEVGGAAAAKQITVAVSYRKLLEVTHFHLFTVPVFLLIVAHLFMLTGLRPSAKAAWIVAAWLAALLHIAAPWLVRYGGTRWSGLYAVSGALLAATAVPLTVYPIWAMWFGAPSRPAVEERTEAQL
jgi:hypothetical protein